MRRIAAAVFAILLTVTLALGVSAASAASGIGSYSTVSSDGGCQVTMSVTFRMEQAVEELLFPLPEKASGVTVNGSRVRTSKDGELRLIDLADITGGIAGTFTVSIHYTLSGVVAQTETGALQLQLPLLSGFAYPVESLDFSVTLPGEIDVKPSFSSGYHQSNIEKDLEFTVSGATITGKALKALKDRETLVMTLAVTEEMFPSIRVEVESTAVDDIAMGVCAGLALLYWILFLRSAPQRRRGYAEPPEGCSAGELGSILNLEGTDLTMMVLSWAQLGYVMIDHSRPGKVLLHKRMEMGNERSAFELRAFRALFKLRTTVDTTGSYYADLCFALSKKAPCLQPLLRAGSGNPRIFRFFAALIGAFGGVSLGIALSGGAALQSLWIAVLAVLGAVSSWVIQGWGGRLFLRSGQKVTASLLCSGLWLLVSFVAGEIHVGAPVVAAQLLAGLMASQGGRRTELGRQVKAEILGLRRYLRTVSKAELQRISAANPDYFFTLAPYALALGVDQAFAKRFGKVRLGACPYVTTGKDSTMTAVQWSELLRRTADTMDARYRQRTLEKFMKLVGSTRRR